MKEINIKKILQFIIPSLIGILLFMMPVPYMDGKFVTYAEGFTIPIAIIKDFIQGLLSNVLSLLILISISITFVVTLYTKLLKPKYILNNLIW